MPRKPHTTASDVNAEKGEVHIDGPGNVAVAMTPEAAEETVERLKTEAKTASKQPENSH